MKTNPIECCICKRLIFEINDPEPVEFVIEEDNSVIDLELGDAVIDRPIVDYDFYYGPTEVTSMLYAEQVLPTQNKIMPANVQVHEIPIYEVSNPKGGITVTIG